MVEGRAGGHGEEAGGRPRQARTHGGGETTLALHTRSESLCSNTCNIMYIREKNHRILKILKIQNTGMKKTSKHRSWLVVLAVRCWKKE
jgi:hypothetical protein